MKRTTKAKSAGKRSRRIKCACASCQCTLAEGGGVRRGNLVFCSETCASRACTVEVCACEHDCCAV
ncbi:MAG TPA: conjugal transfer protein TrbI [Verrucomicrobiae bacterium]|nr:conjugal transfer protein TrbI [Verrucomicrobiae bacterium]